VSLRELRQERDRLRAAFDYNGGRGVDLADEIDKLEAEIELRENPMTIRRAEEVLVQAMRWYLENYGHPECADIADTETLRNAIVDAALDKLTKRKTP